MKQVFVISMFLLLTQIAVAQTTTRAAFVKDSEIYSVNGDGSGLRQLTSDGLGKSLPRWSPDGESIAFLVNRKPDPAEAFANLSVIRKDGSFLRHIAFRPKGPIHVSGMRFVEGFQWIALNRMLLFGSINPSTVEYALFDPETGKELPGALCDGYSFVPSPDGNHWACFGLIPHFSQYQGRFGTLEVDRITVFPSERVQLELLTKPVWSETSDAVAVLIQSGEEEKAVLWRSGAGTSSYKLPKGIATKTEVLWKDKDLFLDAGKTLYQLNERSRSIVEVQPLTTRPTPDQMKRQRGQIEVTVGGLGGRDPDIWPKR